MGNSHLLCRLVTKPIPVTKSLNIQNHSRQPEVAKTNPRNCPWLHTEINHGFAWNGITFSDIGNYNMHIR